MPLFPKPKISWVEPAEFLDFAKRFKKDLSLRAKLGLGFFLSLMFLGRAWTESYSKGIPFRWDLLPVLIIFSFGLVFLLDWFQKSKLGTNIYNRVEIFPKCIRRGKRTIAFTKVTNYSLQMQPVPSLVLFSGSKVVLVAGIPKEIAPELHLLFLDKKIPSRTGEINLAQILSPSPFRYARIACSFGALLFVITLMTIFTAVLANEKRAWDAWSNSAEAKIQRIEKAMHTAGIEKEKIKSLTNFEQHPSPVGLKILACSVPLFSLTIAILFVVASKHYFDARELSLKAKLGKDTKSSD